MPQNGRSGLAVPLNRRNLADAAETRAWFEQRGGEVVFSPSGNVTAQSLREIIFGASRRAHAAMLDEGRHAGSATCSRCFADCTHELESHLPR